MSGSSREHAPWALRDFGIRALLVPSFADIFYGNCLKNGLLPVVLARSAVDDLFQEVLAIEGYRLAIDLTAQTVATPTGEVFAFDIEPGRERGLLDGLDDIALTLERESRIREYESKRRALEPWLFRDGVSQSLDAL